MPDRREQSLCQRTVGVRASLRDRRILRHIIAGVCRFVARVAHMDGFAQKTHPAQDRRITVLLIRHKMCDLVRRHIEKEMMQKIHVFIVDERFCGQIAE